MRRSSVRLRLWAIHLYLLRGMLEGNSFDPLLLDATVKPLPWTNGGPNEDNMEQQPTTDPINSSVADPIFTIKNRVITMKELEALKKRLPPGVDIRVTAKNVVKFRARFRRIGQKEIIKTFPDLKLAKQWLAEQERNALLGIFLPPQATKHTFADAIKRYSKEELPKKEDDARNRQHHLDWWNKHLEPVDKFKKNIKQPLQGILNGLTLVKSFPNISKTLLYLKTSRNLCLNDDFDRSNPKSFLQSIV